MTAISHGWMETHKPCFGEPAPCLGQWCCGCDEHPIGKPWGWNAAEWERHYAEKHGEATA